MTTHVTIHSSASTAVPSPGHAVEFPDGSLRVLTEDIFALADQLAEEELLAEMASYPKRVTGVDNTVWISPRGNVRHGPRIKVAIDPPHAIRPDGKTASVSIVDGMPVAGEEIPTMLLRQVRAFIQANHEVLLEYWDYRLHTDEMEARLKKI